MELEEMKEAWSEMSVRLEKQHLLTNKLIMEMTQEKYRNKINIISKYEGMGTIICFISAIVLILNLYKLDTWYLLASGVFVVGYLIILPATVLWSIKKMRSVNVSANNYKQTLLDYAKNKKQFLHIQRSGIYLNFILILLVMPVMMKISDNEDIFITNHTIWYWYIPAMIFMLLFSRWGYGHYKNITASAEKILKELEN